MPLWWQSVNRRYHRFFCNLEGMALILRRDASRTIEWEITEPFFLSGAKLGHALEAAKAEALRLVRERCQEIAKATEDVT